MSPRPVCVITGASSGLGRGLALRLAQEGYAVALLARRRELLEELTATVGARGGRALPVPCDVTARDEVRTAVERARRELGPVDLLVVNAGISVNTRVEEFDAEAVERVIRTNFLGGVYAVEAVLPEMLARRTGHLVAVSSLAGFGGLPLSAAYCASKAALTTFFESLRLDLRGTGVGVTVISPGFVKTPMTAHNRHPMPFLLDLDDAVERMVRGIRARKKSLLFPRRLGAVVWAARLLPRSWYDALASRIDRRKSPEAGGRPEG